MNKDLQKFRELLLTDEVFQKKLQAASEAYAGEQDEEAVFNNVLVPLAKEYDITATYDEFKAYMESLSGDGSEMSKDELQQVAGGGKNSGQGTLSCYLIGVGVGGANADNRGGGCAGIGLGWGEVSCAGEGSEHGA